MTQTVSSSPLELALGGLATHAEVLVDSGGRRRLEGTTPDVDRRFLLFSLSKTLTALATLLLHDAGELDLDTRVAGVIPAFGANGKDLVTVDDVLTHRGGFPDHAVPVDPLVLDDFADWERAVAKICALPQLRPLVGVATYHAFSYGILAAVIERVTGSDFSTFSSQQVFRPLGMTHTTWGLSDTTRGKGVRMTGPSAGEWEATAILEDGLVPAANAWSTAEDVGAVFALLAAGGAHRGRIVLRESTAALMVAPKATARGQAGAAAVGYGLFVGPERGRDSSFGATASPWCFGHPGFTATTAWHDPRDGITLVALTNASVDQALSDRRFATLSDSVRDGGRASARRLTA